MGKKRYDNKTENTFEYCLKRLLQVIEAIIGSKTCTSHKQETQSPPMQITDENTTYNIKAL